MPTTGATAPGTAVAPTATAFAATTLATTTLATTTLALATTARALAPNSVSLVVLPPQDVLDRDHEQLVRWQGRYRGGLRLRLYGRQPVELVRRVRVR